MDPFLGGFDDRTRLKAGHLFLKALIGSWSWNHWLPASIFSIRALTLLGAHKN